MGWEALSEPIQKGGAFIMRGRACPLPPAGEGARRAGEGRSKPGSTSPSSAASRHLLRRGGRRRTCSELGDLEVLETDLHRRADVDLEGDDALVVELLVGAVDDPGPVEVDRHVLALGGDHEIISVAVLYQLVCLLFRVALQDAAPALLVEQTPVSRGDVGLGAGDDADGSSRTAELDARVAVLVLHLRLEHEVAIGLPRGQELVLLEVPLGPPDDL